MQLWYQDSVHRAKYRVEYKQVEDRQYVILWNMLKLKYEDNSPTNKYDNKIFEKKTLSITEIRFLTLKGTFEGIME